MTLTYQRQLKSKPKMSLNGSWYTKLNKEEGLLNINGNFIDQLQTVYDDTKYTVFIMNIVIDLYLWLCSKPTGLLQ